MQLVRRAMRLPRSPAVVSLHAFAPWFSRPGGLKGSGPPLFYLSGEDDLAIIAQHYDMPALSVRCGADDGRIQDPAGAAAQLGWQVQAAACVAGIRCCQPEH